MCVCVCVCVFIYVTSYLCEFVIFVYMSVYCVHAWFQSEHK